MSTAKKDTGRQFPRMPHERDQSSDSQDTGERREVMEKAYRDVEAGLQDTDRRGVRGFEKPENRVLREKKERAQRGGR